MATFGVSGIHSSAKFASIPRRHRLAAIGLWATAGSWCVQQGTDGFIPDFMPGELGATPALVQCLLDAALWHVAADAEDAGYYIVSWDHHVGRG